MPNLRDEFNFSVKNVTNCAKIFVQNAKMCKYVEKYPIF